MKLNTQLKQCFQTRNLDGSNLIVLREINTPFYEKKTKLKGDFTMFTTIIVIALIVATTGVLAASAGLMLYAKGCTDEEKENMGIRF